MRIWNVDLFNRIVLGVLLPQALSCGSTMSRHVPTEEAMPAAEVKRLCGSVAACEAMCADLFERADRQEEMCGGPGWSLDTCAPAGAEYIQISCSGPSRGCRLPGGRSPPGLVGIQMGPCPEALGAWFARSAAIELASVQAFAQVVASLRAFDAPRRLVAWARQAMREEAVHARLMTGLARRYGAEPAVPVIEDVPPHDMESMAIDNATAGQIGEAVSAFVIRAAALRALDPQVRAAMTLLARDEASHAALAFAIDAWLGGLLSDDQRARVAVARHEALTEALRGEPHEPAAADLGLPSDDERARFLEALAVVHGWTPAGRGPSRDVPRFA